MEASGRGRRTLTTARRFVRVERSGCSAAEGRRCLVADRGPGARAFAAVGAGGEATLPACC